VLKNLDFKNNADFVIAIAVIIVVLMLIIPLPTVLLDVLMAANLTLSLLIVLIVIYTPRAIDFSSFPSVLLISTIFGLGINVSSTRLILAKGANFDGKMVRAFATFVTGAGGTEGVAIGFVIFIILIAVQTFVITKGATRVAEVAARFTLDGMPIKQASIEQEYNSGLITEEEQRKKKLELQQESDFYGSMDGSTKFVSGNVKVGIFITVINLIVGMVFGMVLHKEPFDVALATYTSLTIGDGLLSQLPSLLVSFATGLIVTRSASDGQTTIGSNVKKEFTQSAWIYVIAGGALAALGIIPGFPWYILIPMGALIFYLGFRLLQIEKKKEKTAEEETEKKKAPAGPSGISPVVPLDALSLELGYALIPLVDEEKGGDLRERVGRIRRELGLDLGLVLPPIKMIDNSILEPNEYCFKIRGVEVGRATVRMNWYMCMNTGSVTEEIEGEKTTDPAFGLPAIWLTEDQRDRAQRAGYAVVDSPTILVTHLTEMIKSRAQEILGRQEVQSILDTLKKDFSAVVEEANKHFTVGEIQKVMQGLLREQVSIRNTVSILETMCDYAAITKKTDVLVEKVRQRLGRQICLQYADEKKTIHVLTIEPYFVEKLDASRVETINGPIAALEPSDQRNWISALSASIVAVQEKGYLPIILAPEAVRVLIKSSTEREMPNLVVLSVPEIDKEIRIESLGEIKVGS
jgi:flagellar biosynthesis protein FlhA